MLVDDYPRARSAGTPNPLQEATNVMGLAKCGVENDVVERAIRREIVECHPMTHTVWSPQQTTQRTVTGLIHDLEGIGMDELVFLPCAADMGQLDRLADIVS